LVEWNRLLTQTIGGETTQTASGQLLPDFCRGELVARVLVVAQLLALVAAVLVEGRYSDSPIRTFIMVSLFVHWIALTSIALLCLLRRWLNTLPPERSVLMAYLLLLCVSFAITELSFWVLHWMGMLPTPRPPEYARFHIQNVIVSIVVNALLLRYLLGRDELRRVTMSDAQARSQVQKYRLRPHFLFNSMNMTAGLLRKSPAKAESAIMDMADLFRLMLDDSNSLVSLTKEIELAEKYLSLEKLRLDDRLRVEWDVGRIPRLVRTPVQILQLLLEHAIHIGIDPLSDGGEISITIGADDEEVRIRIECPNSPAVAGVIGEDQQQDAEDQAGGDQVALRGARKRESTPKTVGSGQSGLSGMRADTAADTTTLDNIRMRLADHYASSGMLETHVENELYIVNVRHPASGGVE